MEIFKAIVTTCPHNGNNQPEVRQQAILSYLLQSDPDVHVHEIRDPIPPDSLEDIHSPDYITFLKKVYPSWVSHQDDIWVDETGGIVPKYWTEELIPSLPTYLQSGYYATDADSPIYRDTYWNSMVSANAAKAAVDHLMDEKCEVLRAYAIGEPGHHAKYEKYGGYCFINNAMVAARRFQELGLTNVAVLDLDYHAGNGIPDILEKKPHDGIYAYSLHIDPRKDYPYFESYLPIVNDSVRNFCLPPQCPWSTYESTLKEAITSMQRRNLQALVIAFGADTFKGDPDASKLGRFQLDLPDYLAMGSLLNRAFSNIPIVVTQEGGYNLAAVPTIVGNFLKNL